MRGLGTATVIAALLVGGCVDGATRSADPPVAVPTSSLAPVVASPTDTERFAALAPCDAGGAPGDWLCGVLDVPVDREDPEAGSIPLLVWARPRTDTTRPALDPLFTTPGGPGAPGLQNYGIFWLPQLLGDRRDVITMDPRGTGASAAIDCPDLQDGFGDLDEWADLVGECGRRLGDASDRYGAADRARDVEAVRDWLGYERIVYYGASYGGVDVQAYAARFPERLSSVVLDASFAVDRGVETALGTLDVPTWLRVSELECRADATCAAATSDAAAVLRQLVATVADAPLTGRATDGTAVVVDQTYLAEAAGEMELPALIVAATELLAGNEQALLDYAAEHPVWFRSEGYGPDVTEFSAGANNAGWCTDLTEPYAPTDPADVRRRKLDAAVAALPDDVYAPWTAEGIAPYIGADVCVSWPVPDRHEPVVPPGSAPFGVPALILAGERDRDVPLEASRRLLELFPRGSFVTVAGGGHPTLGEGRCVAELIAEFVSTEEPVEGRRCG